MKSFTYWKTIEVIPGITCEIVRETITSKEGFFNNIVEIIKNTTDFQWIMEETTTIETNDVSFVQRKKDSDWTP